MERMLQIPMEAMAKAAQAAVQRGDTSSIEAVIDGVVGEHARERVRLLWQVELLSYKETCTQPYPTMEDRMTPRQYQRWAQNECGGEQNTRPARRHCIVQGIKEDGSTKYRCIDDKNRNGEKEATTTRESVDTPSFLWPIWVLMTIARICKRRGFRLPACTIGLDDMRHAFRTIPQMMRSVAMVAYFSFSMRTTVFQVISGHSFGSIGSVPNFARLPRLICVVAIIMHLVNARELTS